MDKNLLNQTIENLRKNGFDARLCRNQDEAKTLIAEYIIPYGTLGLGGSTTLRQMQLPELAREHRAKVYDHWDFKLNAEEKLNILRKSLLSDLYLTSANAISSNGKIFNIDGNGNRLAAMMFGPKKVVIVAGYNKIVTDENAAMERIKNYVCGKNAKRLEKKTPCAVSGKCADCQSKDRICAITSIMEKKPGLTDITVIIIEEELGY